MTGITFSAAKSWEITSAALTEILDAGIVADRAKIPPRDYLGMSRLGEECARKLYYEYTQTPKDPGKDFSGRTLRIFERGHSGEVRMANYMRLGGFNLLTERADGKQFGVYIAKDPETGKSRISGHCDGIITGWNMPPDIVGKISDSAAQWAASLPFPLIWEQKAVGSKTFKKYQTNGIKAANRVYYGQMQLYMAYLDLSHALFTAENQDTCEIFAELVPFDARAAQEDSDRGAMVVTAKNAHEVPRVARDETDYRCRFCDYAQRCWKEKPQQLQTTAPLPPWANQSSQEETKKSQGLVFTPFR